MMNKNSLHEADGVIPEYFGLGSIGLALTPLSSDAPLDLLLENKGKESVLACMVTYESEVREEYRDRYEGQLREGKFYDRRVTVGDISPLRMTDPHKRARLAKESAESIIGPGTRWLLGLRGRGLKRITGDSSEDLMGSDFTPSRFHDFEQYRRVNVYLNAALIDGEFVGPQSEVFRTEIIKETEMLLHSFSLFQPNRPPMTLDDYYESQLSGEVVQVEHTPGEEEPHALEYAFSETLRLTERDVHLLKAVGLKGKFEVTGYGGHHPGALTRTLIVQSRPVNAAVELPQPEEGDVIYYQDEDGAWKMYPPDAPVLRKRFRIRPDPSGRGGLHLFTESHYGARTGGGNWVPEDSDVSGESENDAEVGRSRKNAKEEGGGIFTFTEVIRKPPSVPDESEKRKTPLIIKPISLETEGLYLSSPFGEEQPFSVLLTNSSEHYLVSFMILFECFLREDLPLRKRVSYENTARDGRIIDRHFIRGGGANSPLSASLRKRRRRQLSDVSEHIAPGTRWLVSFGGNLSLQEVKDESDLERYKLLGSPVDPLYLNDYSEIRIHLDATLDDGRVVGLHPDLYRKRLQDINSL